MGPATGCVALVHKEMEHGRQAEVGNRDETGKKDASGEDRLQERPPKRTPQCGQGARRLR